MISKNALPLEKGERFFFVGNSEKQLTIRKAML